MRFLSSMPRIECEPYEKLSLIYDSVMKHVNYQRWALYIIELLQHADFPVKSVLEVSCGTGSLGLFLRQRGYEIKAFDYSPYMIRQARHKMQQKGIYFPVWVADVQQYYLHNPVDAVICLYDSMNYLPEENAWRNALNCVYDSLKSGGVFIFDVSTIKNSMDSFRNNKIKDRGPGFNCERYSHFDEKTNLQYNEFEIFFKSEPEKIFKETHKQRILALADIRDLIETDKFEISAAYSDYTTREGTEDSARIHIILKKI